MSHTQKNEIKTIRLLFRLSKILSSNFINKKINDQEEFTFELLVTLRFLDTEKNISCPLQIMFRTRVIYLRLVKFGIIKKIIKFVLTGPTRPNTVPSTTDQNEDSTPIKSSNS